MKRFAMLRTSLDVVAFGFGGGRTEASICRRPMTSGSVSSGTSDGHSSGEHEFRTLELYPKKVLTGRGAPRRARVERPRPPITPRFNRLPSDGAWSDVWPTAQSFRASVVPLPIRQGFTEKEAAPQKYGNAELMKIPNFLHLTPPAIEKHCQAIKKFCSDWPVGLETDEAMQQHFPLKVVAYDYCYAGPSIRNPAARIVGLQVPLSKIELDEHAKDKLLRLVGDRYDLKTDTLTLVADRCPMRRQNYDYALYLLTALVHESRKTESWESDKQVSDMEHYVWNDSKSQANVLQIVKAIKQSEKNGGEPTPATSELPSDPTDEDIVVLEAVSAYGKCVTRLHNEGEDEYTLSLYKESVKTLLNLRDVNEAITSS